jgi:hypothetical protein
MMDGEMKERLWQYQDKFLNETLKELSDSVLRQNPPGADL